MRCWELYGTLRLLAVAFSVEMENQHLFDTPIPLNSPYSHKNS